MKITMNRPLYFICWLLLGSLVGCLGVETAVLPTPPPPTLQPPTATFIPLPSLEATVAAPAETAYPSPPTAQTPQVAYPSVSGTVPTYSYRILNTYPHDPNAFTQGLIYTSGDILYEGTGLRGESTLRRVDLVTGTVQQLHSLAPELFGEGITLFDDKIYQLTWQSNIGFVYDRESFTLLHEFSYPTEGWGITHDGTRLIMSDGSHIIRFWEPKTLTELGQIEVWDENGTAVTQLNELEYINGEIYANIWQTNRIARIDPATGQVLAWIDLSGLLSREEAAQANVLNGIAYDPDGQRLFVTGKLWPKLFEIELVPPAD